VTQPRAFVNGSAWHFCCTLSCLVTKAKKGGRAKAMLMGGKPHERIAQAARRNRTLTVRGK